MKRDMDLCRQILLAIEGDENPTGEDDPGDRVGHHVWLLWSAGLVDGFDCTTGNQHPVAQANCLTWAGHEFLDASRNEGVWNKAKSAVLTATGGASLDLLKRALATYGQQALDAVIGLATKG
jgi:hypothetical protein